MLFTATRLRPRSVFKAKTSSSTGSDTAGCGIAVNGNASNLAKAWKLDRAPQILGSVIAHSAERTGYPNVSALLTQHSIAINRTSAGANFTKKRSAKARKLSRR